MPDERPKPPRMKVKNTKAARRASRESGAEHGNATQKTGPRKAVASMASGHTKVEDLYKSLVEDQTEVISRFLADGTFTYVNAEATKMPVLPGPNPWRLTT